MQNCTKNNVPKLCPSEELNTTILSKQIQLLFWKELLCFLPQSFVPFDSVDSKQKTWRVSELVPHLSLWHIFNGILKICSSQPVPDDIAIRIRIRSQTWGYATAYSPMMCCKKTFCNSWLRSTVFKFKPCFHHQLSHRTVFAN